MNKKRQAIVVILTTMGLFGCKIQKDEKECVDPPNTVVSQTASTSAGDKEKKKLVVDKNDVNWCRACVVGPHGFMSCQRVDQSNTGETDKELREKSRLKACTDSGFTETNCPPDKVISVVCKTDPPPKDKRAAGEALLKALKTSGPLVLTEDGTRFTKEGKEPPKNDTNASKDADASQSPAKTPQTAPGAAQKTE